MKKVTLDEVMGLERYEQVRPDFRRRIIEVKTTRRVPIGDRITFVFENHDTMHFQIQEMLRASTSSIWTRCVPSSRCTTH